MAEMSAQFVVARRHRTSWLQGGGRWTEKVEDARRYDAVPAKMLAKSWTAAGRDLCEVVPEPEAAKGLEGVNLG